MPVAGENLVLDQVLSRNFGVIFHQRRYTVAAGEPAVVSFSVPFSSQIFLTSLCAYLSNKSSFFLGSDVGKKENS